MVSATLPPPPSSAQIIELCLLPPDLPLHSLGKWRQSRSTVPHNICRPCRWSAARSTSSAWSWRPRQPNGSEEGPEGGGGGGGGGPWAEEGEGGRNRKGNGTKKNDLIPKGAKLMANGWMRGRIDQWKKRRE